MRHKRIDEGADFRFALMLVAGMGALCMAILLA